MKALEHQLAYNAFLNRVRSASDRILLLDYDGTVAPFSVDRNHAFPYPELPALLTQIMAKGTRIVLISGRPARELVLLCGIQPPPEIWGSHGLDRLKPDGTYQVYQLPQEQQRGLLLASKAVESGGLERNMELKPGSVAVHWRGFPAPEIDAVKSKVLQLWTPLLAEYPLHLLEFDGGLELRVPGRNKGEAVRSVLAETTPGAAVAYLGDDQTDEDAFRALKGKGLTVLVRPEPRPTSADLWLQPPQELIHFLEEWLHASGGKA